MDPQPDLDTLASKDAISSCKIDRETVEDDGDRAVAYSPPESFWLSKDAEFDWFDRHAFFERKDSTKGNFNLSSHVKPSVSVQSSQRFSVSLKSRASIIGLPKTQKATFVDSGRRTCKANLQLFPKRSVSAGVSRVLFAEPVSPKVSCIGRVRSRDRRKSNSLRKSQKLPEKSKTGRQKPEKSKAAGGKKKTGLYSKVMGIFRLKNAKKALRSRSRKVAEEDPPVIGHYASVSFNAASEPPGLAALQRFASGRRSGSWAVEDSSSVAVDFDRRVYGTLFQESREKTLRRSSYN